MVLFSPIIFVITYDGYEALTFATILRICGITNSSGGQESFIARPIMSSSAIILNKMKLIDDT